MVKINNSNMHYLNDKWVTADQLNLSFFDLSIIRGYGVFDFVKSVNKKFIWKEDYVARLKNSAREYGLNLKYSTEEIFNILDDVLLKNPEGDVYVRLVLTGGISEDSLSAGHDNSFAAIVNYAKPIDTSLYEEGAKFITHVGTRPNPNIKSINYSVGMFARNKHKGEDFIDILLVSHDDDPLIYEGSVNNLFFVKDDKVITSPLDKVLRGVMQKKTIEVMLQIGLKIEYDFLSVSEVEDCDEVFSTNSSLRIYPVSHIDTLSPRSCPGKLTNEIKKRLDSLIESASTA